MKYAIHSNGMWVTPAMKSAVEKSMKKIEPLLTPDTSIKITLGYAVSNKIYYFKVKVVLESVKYTIQVKSSKETFYESMDEVTTKLKETIYRRNKKMLEKKRRSSRKDMVNMNRKIESFEKKFVNDDFVSINGIVYGDDDFSRQTAL